MNKFNQIACADIPALVEYGWNALPKYSEMEIKVPSKMPQSNSEIIANIGDADCALVSFHTQIDKEVIEACPNLKYIGMCCSLYDAKSANVDIEYATTKGIKVLGVRDYGDEGVVEYMISELIRISKGLGDHQWKSEPVELGGQKIGIIGLGTSGIMTAEACKFFGMDVYYYSRTRKPEQEAKGFKYLELDQLLKECDIITTQIQKNTELLQEQHFKALGDGKILINTTIGPTFNMSAFENWIATEGNFAIIDRCGAGTEAEKFAAMPNVILSPVISGLTSEAKVRLSKKVINNIESILG